MPNFTYHCSLCNASRNEFRAYDDAERPMLCKCGGWMLLVENDTRGMRKPPVGHETSNEPWVKKGRWS